MKPRVMTDQQYIDIACVEVAQARRELFSRGKIQSVFDRRARRGRKLVENQIERLACPAGARAENKIDCAELGREISADTTRGLAAATAQRTFVIFDILFGAR